MVETSRIAQIKLPSWHMVVGGLVLLIFASVVGCGTMRLNSHWLDRRVTIDGSADDWEGLMVPVDGGWGGGRLSGGMGRGDRGGPGAPGQTPAEFDVSARVRLAPAPPV